MKLRNTLFETGLTLGLLLGAVWPLGALDLGEPAPPIEIADWIKGPQVSLDAARGTNVVVLDFWGTASAAYRYSIPYLSNLQKKYKDKGVVILGITSEPSERVKSDLSRLEAAVEYGMAIDSGQKTSNCYLKGIKGDELPHSFVIDKGGKLVWHGNSTVALDQVLQEVLDGKLDPEWARRTVTAEKLMHEYYRIASTGVTNARMAELGDQIVANATKYPSILNEFAWRILTDRRIRKKDYPLALRASRAAYEMSGDLVPIMDTYARALFQNGKQAEAMEMEKKAIASCSDTHFRPELESVLMRFQRLSRTNGTH